MLGERLNWNINIGEKSYVLKFNVKALKNIYKLTGISPFEFIDKFNGEDSDNKYLYQMLMAMSDLEITLKDLTSIVTEENKNEIKQLIILYLNKEFTSEFTNEENKNDDSDNNSNEEEIDKLVGWINWYNYYYYLMRYQLKMTEDEFESLTIREVKTLTDQHKMFNKNILLSAYIDIVKSKNENKVEEVAVNNNIRIKDMFLNISR